MKASQVSLAVSLALLAVLRFAAAGIESDDSKVLHAAVCSPALTRGVLVATTLNTSGSHSPPPDMSHQGLSDDFSDALNDLRSRNSGSSKPLPEGFKCPSLKIVPRSDLASWYEHNDWKAFRRAFPGFKRIREVSLPGYNRARDLALVQIAVSCDDCTGVDQLFAFHKVDGKGWEPVAPHP
jgi:hypothetical protein